MTQTADELNCFYVEINAMHCATRKQLINEFVKAFQIPDSCFGWNLDALDDCMTDLGWLPEKRFHITVINFSLLQEVEPDQAAYLRDMLGDIETYWDVKSQQAKGQYLSFNVKYE